MTRERCSACGSMLLWANHRLVCPRPHCPGHQSGNTFAALAPCAVEDGTPHPARRRHHEGGTAASSARLFRDGGNEHPRTSWRV